MKLLLIICLLFYFFIIIIRIWVFPTNIVAQYHIHPRHQNIRRGRSASVTAHGHFKSKFVWQVPCLKNDSSKFQVKEIAQGMGSVLRVVDTHHCSNQFNITCLVEDQLGVTTLQAHIMVFDCKF